MNNTLAGKYTVKFFCTSTIPKSNKKHMTFTQTNIAISIYTKY